MAVSMDDRWIYIEGKRDGRAYVANVRHPLEALRNPEYEHHVALTLSYAAHWRTGLPKPHELTRLQDFEDSMIVRLQGHGILAGSETCDATRIVHLYLRGGGALLEVFRKRERAGQQGGLKTTVTHDPEWCEIAHLAQASERAAAA
jgi:hypothetical protein